MQTLQPEYKRMEIAGYAASLFIGITLGLIGGGGSIITVPVLVYLFGIDAALATYYSLFVVGISSLVGTWPKYFKGYVHLKTAWLFGIPSIAGVLLARRVLLPLIPDAIITIGNFTISKSLFLLTSFALLMLLASVAMIRGRGEKENMISDDLQPSEKRNSATLLTRGFLVGLVTGIVGVGGGFLIIPSLVILLGFNMKDAVGTSLFIIAINSLLGFFGDLDTQTVTWVFLLSITALAVLGIIIGNLLSNRIDGAKLRNAFGYFVLVMGLFIITKEWILPFL